MKSMIASSKIVVPTFQNLYFECSIIIDQSGSHTFFLYVSAAIVIVLALLRLLMEVIQLYKSRIYYFSDYENWIELVLYFSAIFFTFVFANDCACPFRWQWQLGSIAVFLGWIIFIFFVRKLPHIGKHV